VSLPAAAIDEEAVVVSSFSLKILSGGTSMSGIVFSPKKAASNSKLCKTPLPRPASIALARAYSLCLRGSFLARFASSVSRKCSCESMIDQLIGRRGTCERASRNWRPKTFVNSNMALKPLMLMEIMPDNREGSVANRGN
jgi:hypothetical protein